MWRFWDRVVRSALSAAEARTVVEIGAEHGFNTQRLVEWATANGAVVHVIDPYPRFDPEELGFPPDTLVFHRSTSLEALPGIERPDAVLIDGDHNWYTVTEELRVLERIGDWPITFLHDIAWPYGRRDMYHQPERIPAEHRQPWERMGLLPGRSELSPDGYNTEIANATHEGGPRNGVLTAIEDFIDESAHDLELFTVSGNSGLAVLLDRDRLETELGGVLRRAHDQPFGHEMSPRYVS